MASKLTQCPIKGCEFYGHSKFFGYCSIHDPKKGSSSASISASINLDALPERFNITNDRPKSSNSISSESNSEQHFETGERKRRESEDLIIDGEDCLKPHSAKFRKFSKEESIDVEEKSVKRDQLDRNIDEEMELADFLEIDDIDDPSESTRKSTIQVLELRPYQKELAATAVNGSNVMIVAPTNAGKTHVGMYIAQSHLFDNEKHRVIFIVHRVHLVDQQYQQFCRYFNYNDVTHLYGGGSSVIPLSRILKSKKVVVLTVDILRNALITDSEERLSMDQVSLLIFDECHNCMKDHPYNVVMDYYFNSSLNKRPQIVGLTASPGTGQANSLQEAFVHLLTLCGNLDCKRISYKSEEDVQNYMIENDTSVAMETEYVRAKTRSEKWLDEKIQGVMAKCEKALVRLKMRFVGDYERLLRVPSSERGMSQYTNFVGELGKIATCIRPTDDSTRTVAECLRALLDTLNRTLKVYMLFRDEDAIDYLKNYLGDENTSVHEIERRLRETLKVDVLDEYEANIEVNPCLEELKMIVFHQIKKSPDSRVLVFVSDRLYAAYLLNAFKVDDRLSHIPGDVIVGSQNDLDTIKATKNWQKEVLEKFRNGKNLILFSTSIAEEGLDVVKCNMVIRYVNVSNEIAMRQSKGRARAGYSKYVLIYHEEADWIGKKEEKNVLRNDLMIDAIEKFQTHSNVEPLVDRMIRERNMQRLKKRTAIENAASSLPTTEFRFLCRKCQTYASSSTYVRRKYSHYFCIDPELKEKTISVECENQKFGDYEITAKIFCFNCKKHPWGVLCRYLNSPYIALSITSFNLFPVLPDGQLGSCQLCKKWSKAPFQIADLEFADIFEDIK